MFVTNSAINIELGLPENFNQHNANNNEFTVVASLKHYAEEYWTKNNVVI